MFNKENTVYLSLGSNIGNKMFYLLNAIVKINELEFTKIVKVSKFYTTEPYGDIVQDNFLNCAIKIKTRLLPYELLKKINQIEHKLNRKRVIKWGPRTIDIDIIFYDNLKLNRENLIIPHKDYKKRNFVLYPLRDIIDDMKFNALFYQATGEIFEYKYEKKIMISTCLLGVNCKYSGGNNLRQLLKDIMLFDYLPVCPETLGGMKIPRVPSEIQKDRKVYDKNGEDVTKYFEKGTRKVLELAEKNSIELAFLKSKSPSCGYGKIYDGSFKGKLIAGNGLSAEELEKIGILIIEVN